MKSAIGQIEDGILSSFSKSLGVTSYRQMMEDMEAAKIKREATMREVNAAVASIRQQVWLCLFVRVHLFHA